VFAAYEKCLRLLKSGAKNRKGKKSGIKIQEKTIEQLRIPEE
jgi:hypothetical protein